MVWNHNYVCTNLIIRKEHNSCSYLCQYGRKGCLAVTRLESCTGGFWSGMGLQFVEIKTCEGCYYQRNPVMQLQQEGHYSQKQQNTECTEK